MAALPMLAMAQNSLDVKLDSAGQLATKIADDQRFKISDFKISGPLNGDDLKLLQQIVTRTKAKNPDECLVNSVDLAGATIIESNIKGAIKTQADELPAGMFAGAKALKKVVLPSGLKSIGKEAFQTCESLPEIIIPSGV